MMRRWWVFVAVAALGVTVPACSGRSAAPVPVSGKVTLHGKPLPADATAYVVFTPTKPGSKPMSAPIKDGHYDAPEAPSGPVTVSFDITRPNGPPRKSDRTGQMYQDILSLVPSRYVSGIPLTIDGPTTKDFDLVD